MKVLVIGAAGQLGTEICGVYKDEDLVRADLDGAEVHLDITDRNAVQEVILEDVKPDLIVNTAAAHNVPLCEVRPENSFAVNATGPKYIAEAAYACGAALVHISTDYVFGNESQEPRTEVAAPCPLNTYGASKLAGEYLVAAECPRHYIVRAAALYGASPCRAKRGKNFVDLMLHLAETRGAVSVVTDEVTSPTYTVSLAKQIKLLVEKGTPGVYHATSNGECSWYEFAQAIFEITGAKVNLNKALAKDFPNPVKRPHYSVLANSRLKEQGIDIMPAWRDALELYLRKA